MDTLQIETGIKEFTVKGDYTGEIVIRFSPTDMFFAQKLYSAFEALDEKQKKYDATPKMGNAKKAFELSEQIDRDMRETIDTIFGAPVSAAVFSSLHAYSMSKGLPLWCNLVLAVMDEMDDSFSREQKAMNPRIQKYTAKYHK